MNYLKSQNFFLLHTCTIVEKQGIKISFSYAGVDSRIPGKN
jgi:hypothetical protein